MERGLQWAGTLTQLAQALLLKEVAMILCEGVETTATSAWRFPAALAYAMRVALDLGQDPDEPPWTDAYLATARR